MDKQRIREKVISILQEQLDPAFRPIKDSHAIMFDFLDTDSLDIIELVMAFEETFEITADEEEYKDIETVGQVIEFINKKVNG
jgi:acyl carrier protein